MDGASLPSPALGDPEIRGLTADSRDVKAGFLFAALPGTKTDGRRFIDDAIARGAVAILVDSGAFAQPARVRIIADPNPRRRLAQIAARFHAPQPKTIAAVTGTNGKTSVTVFARQIWQRNGQPAASLGTIGIVGPDFTAPGALTTPDPVALHRTLNEIKQRGIDHVAIEASSHGLDQCRLDGLALKAAAFTNLTRDHLDYHCDMEAYFTAKARLFTELLPADGTAVLNADVAAGQRLAALARKRGQRVLTYGRAAEADLRLLSARPTEAGQELELAILGERQTVVLPLVGGFQAANALAALGLAIATGVPARAAADVLPHLTGAPGRLEPVATHPNGASVIVDYAHTPDALETVLTALRAHCRGRLVVVFGCGGERDPGKRPQMGAIAARLADTAIVTDDNPRSENPAAIRRAILAASPGAEEIGDRAAAIRHGISLLKPGDLLLIAGKGHEQGQIVAGVTHPFEDASVARTVLAEIGGRA